MSSRARGTTPHPGFSTMIGSPAVMWSWDLYIAVLSISEGLVHFWLAYGYETFGFPEPTSSALGISTLSLALGSLYYYTADLCSRSSSLSRPVRFVGIAVGVLLFPLIPVWWYIIFNFFSPVSNTIYTTSPAATRLAPATAPTIPVVVAGAAAAVTRRASSSRTHPLLPTIPQVVIEELSPCKPSAALIEGIFRSLQPHAMYLVSTCGTLLFLVPECIALAHMHSSNSNNNNSGGGGHISHVIHPFQYLSVALTIISIVSKGYAICLSFQIKVVVFKYALVMFDVFSLIYTLFAVSSVQPDDQALLFGAFHMSYLSGAWIYLLIFKLCYVGLVYIVAVLYQAILEFRAGRVCMGIITLLCWIAVACGHVIAVGVEATKLTWLLCALMKMEPQLSGCIHHLEASHFLENSSSSSHRWPPGNKKRKESKSSSGVGIASDDGGADEILDEGPERRLQVLLAFTAKPGVDVLAELGIRLPVTPPEALSEEEKLEGRLAAREQIMRKAIAAAVRGGGQTAAAMGGLPRGHHPLKGPPLPPLPPSAHIAFPVNGQQHPNLSEEPSGSSPSAVETSADFMFCQMSEEERAAVDLKNQEEQHLDEVRLQNLKEAASIARVKRDGLVSINTWRREHANKLLPPVSLCRGLFATPYLLCQLFSILFPFIDFCSSPLARANIYQISSFTACCLTLLVAAAMAPSTLRYVKYLLLFCRGNARFNEPNRQSLHAAIVYHHYPPVAAVLAKTIPSHLLNHDLVGHIAMFLGDSVAPIIQGGGVTSEVGVGVRRSSRLSPLRSDFSGRIFHHDIVEEEDDAGGEQGDQVQFSDSVFPGLEYGGMSVQQLSGFRLEPDDEEG